MKQTIVIKVAMTCDKCRSKALSLVAATGGVDSVKLAGDTKDQVVVEGEVDAIKLTCTLRKKVGPALLIEVVDTAKKKEEEKKKKEEEEKKKKKEEQEKLKAACASLQCPCPPYPCPPYPCPPYPCPPYHVPYCEDVSDHACTVM